MPFPCSVWLTFHSSFLPVCPINARLCGRCQKRVGRGRGGKVQKRKKISPALQAEIGPRVESSWLFITCEEGQPFSWGEKVER